VAFHLAQVNIARPLEPLDSELLAEFVASLDSVNAVADGAPGFVWRLQGEDGNATSVPVFDDQGLIVNMSVWESLEALRAFVYSTPAHLAVMKRRREWFERMEVHMALWWVPAGHVPTVAEAEERLTLLGAVGPSPDAFTFRCHFPPPDDGLGDQAIEDDRWLCPA
jgi:heme-degrading monooxygenase HmoA